MNTQIFFSCFPTLQEFADHNKVCKVGNGYSYSIIDDQFVWSFNSELHSNSFLFPSTDKLYYLDHYSEFFYNRMRFLNKSVTARSLETFNDLKNAAYHYFSDGTMRWFNCRISDGNIRSIRKLGITIIMQSVKNHSICSRVSYEREYKIIAVDHLYNEIQKKHMIYDIQDRSTNYRQTKKNFELVVRHAHQGIIPQIVD